MKRLGMHITLLAGVPNYYHQFGYVAVQPQHSVSVLASTVAERLPAPPAGLTIADATMDDAAAISAIYDADNATRSGTVDRPLEMLTAQLKEALGPDVEPPISSWRFVMRVDGDFVLQMMNIALQMMHVAFQMMIFGSKMMIFASIMMNFVFKMID